MELIQRCALFDGVSYVIKNLFIVGLLILSMLFSCSEEDGLTPMTIIANSDTVTLIQNSATDINVLLNDINVPNQGNLTWTDPTLGSLTRNDPNNTPNNPSDDSFSYTANANETGLDSFEYTICDGPENCATANVSISITSGNLVNFDLDEMPYQTLSEYGFFEGELKNLSPTFGVLPYDLNSSLFSDYAKKRRFVWMPNNKKANYINENVHLEFPVGAILIKNFYYSNALPNNQTRIVETRLMIKKETGWIFANYIWNEEQTEALFDLNGRTIEIQWIDDGQTNTVDYRVPSEAKCFTCHKVSAIAQPIGPKPRNLNRDYVYDTGVMNQLSRWVSNGYLQDELPLNISSIPDYNDTSASLDLRARAYLDINCAHCHSEDTHCAYRPLRLDFSDTGSLINAGVCVDPDTDLGEDLGHIVEPGDARFSVLHFRLNSTDQAVRMPLLGRTLIHTQGVNLIEAWIDSLETECN